MNTFSDNEIDVTTGDTAKALDEGSALVIDVREPYEREAGHIAGTRHIELERLASKAPELPQDQPIIFQCRLGARSAMAASAFRRAGYDAYSMAGGVTAWAAEGRPLVPEDGYVADH